MHNSTDKCNAFNGEMFAWRIEQVVQKWQAIHGIKFCPVLEHLSSEKTAKLDAFLKTNPCTCYCW